MMICAMPTTWQEDEELPGAAQDLSNSTQVMLQSAVKALEMNMKELRSQVVASQAIAEAATSQIAELRMNYENTVAQVQRLLEASQEMEKRLGDPALSSQEHGGRDASPTPLAANKDLDKGHGNEVDLSYNGLESLAIGGTGISRGEPSILERLELVESRLGTRSREPKAVCGGTHSGMPNVFNCEDGVGSKSQRLRPVRGTTGSTHALESSSEHQLDDEYCLQESVWDATILLLCKDEQGRRLLTLGDRIAIVIGFLINLGVQGLFLAIVRIDMLPSRDYSPDQTEFLLAWRATSGHNFNTAAGKSEVDLLCSKFDSAWTFTKDTFEVVRTYLSSGEDDGPFLIPGYFLSMLSIFLWSLFVMKEYRSALTQAIGITSLPRDDTKPAWQFSLGTLRVTFEEDSVSGEVVHMNKCAKLLVMLVMTLPRLLMLGFLAVYGCEFVATTASLSDLVLNALALGFVLDIDDLLASVIFSRTVREACVSVKPLRVGEYGNTARFQAIKLMGVTRHVLWLILVFTAILGYLWPFYADVAAARLALCHGNTDFYVEGGNVSVPTTIIVDMASSLMNERDGVNTYYSTCSSSVLAKYYEEEYSLPNYAPADHDEHQFSEHEVTERRNRLILEYAFKDVDIEGLAELGTGALKNAFDQLEFNGEKVRFGKTAMQGDGFQRCPNFEEAHWRGWDACVPFPSLASLNDVSNCSWTHTGKICEGISPGQLFLDACDITTGSAQQKSCEIWNSTGVENPYVNCEGGELQLNSAFVVDVSDSDLFIAGARDPSGFGTQMQIALRQLFEELPAARQAPGSAPLNLTFAGTSLVQLEDPDVVPSRRLGLGSHRRSSSSSSNGSTTSDARQLSLLAHGVRVRYRVDMLPATFTTSYHGQVDWAAFSSALLDIVQAYDIRLVTSNVTAELATKTPANCSTYVWCAEGNLILRDGAANITGASQDTCCESTCLSWWLTESSPLTHDLCLHLGNYQVMSSDERLLATRASLSDLTVCCEEQLRCSDLDPESCAQLSGAGFNALIPNAEEQYQGVAQRDAPACCSMTCESIASHGIPGSQWRLFCDPALGMVNSLNSSTTVPSNVSDIVSVESACCEATSEHCDLWHAALPLNSPESCEAHNAVLSPDAASFVGEHWTFCCTDACLNLPIQCPANYSLRSEEVLAVTAAQVPEMPRPSPAPTYAPASGLTCNPSTCPRGLTCMDDSCCDEEQWRCCDLRGGRKYCPLFNDYDMMCAEGKCVTVGTANLCNAVGGVGHPVRQCVDSCPEGYELLEGASNGDIPLQTFIETSIVDCATHCNFTPSCKAFEWNQKICLLHDRREPSDPSDILQEYYFCAKPLIIVSEDSPCCES